MNYLDGIPILIKIKIIQTIPIVSSKFGPELSIWFLSTVNYSFSSVKTKKLQFIFHQKLAGKTNRI